VERVSQPVVYDGVGGADWIVSQGTTIQLVERFYDPVAGTVTVDGEDISEFNVQSYRKNIALVSQEVGSVGRFVLFLSADNTLLQPTLYAGTVKFNILLGCTRPESEVTQEEIETACRNAKLVSFYLSSLSKMTIAEQSFCKQHPPFHYFVA
jgi:ATP-binding cassette subfamily B (MDR/TAP) protein 1